jgi:hypothetical protein
MSDELMAMLNYCCRGLKNKRALIAFKLQTALIFDMFYMVQCGQTGYAAKRK